jgi:cyclophilin family peptidyl-prolyl cis-trans isomerase
VLIETACGNIKLRLYKETPLHQENFIKLARQGYFNGLSFHRVIQNFMIQGGDPESRNAQPAVRLGSGNPGYTIPAEINRQFFHKKGALSAARQGDNVNPEKRSSGSQFFIVQGKTFTKEELGAIQQSKNAKRVELIFHRLFTENKEEFMRLRQEGKNEEFEVCIAELQEKAEAEAKQVGDFAFSPEQIEAYTTLGGYPSLDNEYTVFGEVVEGLDVIDKIADEATDQYDRPLKDIKFTITVVRK